MLGRQAMYVDGAWRRPHSLATLPVVCPSSEAVVGTAPDADAADIDIAVAAARRAFDSGPWPRMSLDERIATLERALDLLVPKLAEIARLVTTEMGVPIAAGRQLIPIGLETGRYFLRVAREVGGTDLRRGSQLAAVFREPLGVVASIAAWNGPFNIAVSKVIPALVAGCAVVFKPAPETPLDAEYLADAFAAAGVPPGVFNVVFGGRDAGRTLVAHAGIDKVSFTGSTAAGRDIGEVCGRGLKRVQLELGGKSAAIVAPDADIERVKAGITLGSFFNCGQMCIAFTRVLAPRSRYDEVVSTIGEIARSFRIADPFEEATTMGPVVSARQLSRIEGYIAGAQAEGARLVAGGRRPPGLARGWFIEPTVFADVRNSMTLAREEVFGPVIGIIPYDGIDEAVAIANDSPYGLHGGIFTRDERLALKVARSIRTGTFSVNAFVYNVEAPFGGVKCSGIGRDTGREAVESYYELKTVNLTPSMESLVS
jgi:acyl-CoA reductase-like NAD-dependent aldehyde dehydrogenase